MEFLQYLPLTIGRGMASFIERIVVFLIEAVAIRLESQAVYDAYDATTYYFVTSFFVTFDSRLGVYDVWIESFRQSHPAERTTETSFHFE
jgi:hypothetical protein